MHSSRFFVVAIAAAMLLPACKRKAAHPIDVPKPTAQAAAAPAGDDGDAVVPPGAAALDEAGKLAEALSAYKARADVTGRDADRLRYARALLRAGQPEPAKKILDDIARETEKPGDRAEPAVGKAGVVASSLLAGGFPGLAVPYARAAAGESSEPKRALLLLRSLAASGDAEAARGQARNLCGSSEKWEPGQRYELARAFMVLGDDAKAEKLLGPKATEAVAELFHSSIRANVAFVRGDWQSVEKALADAERAAPTDLGGKVAKHWRNARRELFSVRLRRAIALMRLGKVPDAVAELNQAKRTDEEAVRSAAVLLLASSDLTSGRRDAAFATLEALAGHDPRLRPSIAALEQAVTAGALEPETVAPLERALAAEDATAAFVARQVCGLLVSGAKSPSPAPTVATSKY